MTRILTIIVLTFLFSCSSEDHWKKFKAHGLPDQDDHYEDILFINDSVGYLGGRRTVEIGLTNDNYVLAERTILYKTRDRGKSWKKLPLDLKGSVNKIFCFDETIIVLLQFITTDTSYILKSSNEGRTWSPILTLTADNYVRDIYFKSPTKGFIATDNRKSQFLMEFNINKWDTTLNLTNNTYHHKIFNDRVISLTQVSALSSGTQITNLQTLKKTIVTFDKPYYVASSTKYNNSLLLAVHDSVSGKILRLTGNKVENITLGDYSNYLPEKVFVHDKTVLVIAYRQKDVAFLGVIHSLLISRDNGETWTLEEFPSSMSIEPAFMYRDKYFISSCLPPGFIQMRQ
jgi:hypothetical protein